MQVPLLPIVGKEGFFLKPNDMRYAESLREALNDPMIAHDVSNIPNPYEIEDAIKWIDGRAGIITNDSRRIDWLIIKEGVDGDEDVAGSVGFFGMNEMPAKKHVAQVSMLVARNFRGHGIAPAAVKTAIKFAFEDLGLHKIHGYAHPENKPSIAAMGKIGMTHDATIPDDWVRVIDGRECLADSYICSITNPESQYKRLPEDYRSRFSS